MSAHIKVDGSLDVDPQRLVEFVANHSIAGETVRLDPKVKFRSEDQAAADARVEQFGERELTVSELRMDATPDGPMLNYRFEGVEGLHNAKAFQNPEGFEQDYGVLIQRDGETWFVPFKDSEATPAGDAKRVAPVMNRCGHYHFGLSDEVLEAVGRQGQSGGQTVEEFLAQHEADPTAGEYALSPLADGTWRLDASPWMSSASEKEIEASEEAIAAARSAPSPR